MYRGVQFSLLFFFNDTATTEIYTLSLHDALPISSALGLSNEPATGSGSEVSNGGNSWSDFSSKRNARTRSEEHTSELQSHLNLVCRLLLEKKKSRSIPDRYPR